MLEGGFLRWNSGRGSKTESDGLIVGLLIAYSGTEWAHEVHVVHKRGLPIGALRFCEDEICGWLMTEWASRVRLQVRIHGYGCLWMASTADSMNKRVNYSNTAERRVNVSHFDYAANGFMICS